MNKVSDLNLFQKLIDEEIEKIKDRNSRIIARMAVLDARQKFNKIRIDKFLLPTKTLTNNEQ